MAKQKAAIRPGDPESVTERPLEDALADDDPTAATASYEVDPADYPVNQPDAGEVEAALADHAAGEAVGPGPLPPGGDQVDD